MNESSEPRDTLDMTDQRWNRDGFWDVCKTFEQIMAGGKLHQYLRILVKAGILDIQHADDADLMNKFLSRPDLHRVAREAWETQAVLVSVQSGVNVHNLAYHVHGVIEDRLLNEEATCKAVEHFKIEDPSTEDVQRKIGKARLPIKSLDLRSPYNLEQQGYSRVGHLLGLSKNDLLEIEGVGEKTADAILEALHELFTENSRAVSLVKRV